jgi:hypothetical protein
MPFGVRGLSNGGFATQFPGACHFREQISGSGARFHGPKNSRHTDPAAGQGAVNATYAIGDGRRSVAAVPTMSWQMWGGVTVDVDLRSRLRRSAQQLGAQRTSQSLCSGCRMSLSTSSRDLTQSP